MAKKQFPLLVLLLLFVAGCQQKNCPSNRSQVNSRRIGVYDSRAILIAFMGSKVYEKTAGRELEEMTDAYQKAEAAGEADKMKKLQEAGKALQALRHRQAFGTESVEDILAHLGSEINQIKKEAGVSAILSKWDSVGLSSHQKAEKADLTMTLVDAFGPTPKQRKSAIDIQDRDPVDLGE